MPLQLMMCRLCTQSRPDFVCAVAQLMARYPDDIEIIELECMAACDDVPAVMVETDYHPQLTPEELIRLVQDSLQVLR